jgi:hypothetical protein
MKKKNQPFETRAHDLTGHASLDLYKDFSALATQIAGYNADRFDPVALKIFSEKGSLIITLYAFDKEKAKSKNLPRKKFPVKKFKVQMSWDDFIRHVKNFDVVVSGGEYDISGMVVENK